MRRQILVATAAGAMLATGLTGVHRCRRRHTRRPQGGSFTLTGQQAASYQVPGDMGTPWSTTLGDGTGQTRYQQVARGPPSSAAR